MDALPREVSPEAPASAAARFLAFVTEQFPLNRNGKPDRKQLERFAVAEQL